MTKPTINLGSGSNPWGDVRADIVPNRNLTLILDLDNVPYPFSDKAFSEVRLFHVLEHCKNPQAVFKEAQRIGETVHAKFPWKRDRIPVILAMLTSLNASMLYHAVHDCVLHVLSQIGLIDSVWQHRWLICPFGRSQVNNVVLFSFLHSGRNARFFKSIRLPQLKSEWECWLE